MRNASTQLLIFAAVFVFGSGGASGETPPMRDADAVAEKLLRLGAKVRPFDGNPNEVEVKIERQWSGTDADVALLKQIPKVKSVIFSDVGVSDEAVRHVSEIKRLTKLVVCNTNVTEKGFSPLNNLENIEFLGLVDCRISDKTLRTYGTMTKLREIYLYNTRLTGAGFAGLSGLRQVDTLHCGNTLLDDEGLRYIHNFPNLQFLFLEDTRISDAGLPYVGRLRHLTHLRLQGTEITDTGVYQLRKCKLQRLELANTRVTNRCLGTLRSMASLEYVDFIDTNVSEPLARQLMPKRCSLRFRPFVLRIDLSE